MGGRSNDKCCSYFGWILQWRPIDGVKHHNCRIFSWDHTVILYMRWKKYILLHMRWNVLSLKSFALGNYRLRMHFINNQGNQPQTPFQSYILCKVPNLEYEDYDRLTTSFKINHFLWIDLGNYHHHVQVLPPKTSSIPIQNLELLVTLFFLCSFSFLISTRKSCRKLHWKMALH